MEELFSDVKELSSVSGRSGRREHSGETLADLDHRTFAVDAIPPEQVSLSAWIKEECSAVDAPPTGNDKLDDVYSSPGPQWPPAIGTLTGPLFRDYIKI